MFGGTNIEYYYIRLFDIADNTKAVTISELELMIPFEIDMYEGLLTKRMKRDDEIRRNSRNK